MNLIEMFQDLVAQVPEFLQPLIVAAAGAVPFIEGEGAAAIGILGGINPIVAAIAAIAGNFLCVALLVMLSAGARNAVTSRRRSNATARVGVAVNGGTMPSPPHDFERSAAPGSPRAAKFQRALVRYGVPGVSLLGPLLLPTQFTATMLAAAGVGKARILIWQLVAIVAWTTAVTLIVSGVISAVS